MFEGLSWSTPSPPLSTEERTPTDSLGVSIEKTGNDVLIDGKFQPGYELEVKVGNSRKMVVVPSREKAILFAIDFLMSELAPKTAKKAQKRVGRAIVANINEEVAGYVNKE